MASDLASDVDHVIADYAEAPAVHVFDVFIKGVFGDNGIGVTTKPTERGLLVVDVLPQSRLSAWNEKCAQTFPDDEIRKGDIIFLVNQIGPDQSPELTCSDKCSSMSAQLGSFDDLLIIVQRDLA